MDESKRNQLELITEEDTTLADEPDTSSFTAFLYSLLSSSEGNDANLGEQNDIPAEKTDEPSENVVRESGGRRGLLSKGKQSLRALYQVAKLGSLRSQERRTDSQLKVADEGDDNLNGLELKDMQNEEEPVSPGVLPGISEPSMLLSEKSRSNLYASLPALVQGRKWLLLYRCRNLIIYLLYFGILKGKIVVLSSFSHHFTILFTVRGGMGYLFQHCIDEACFGLGSVCW